MYRFCPLAFLFAASLIFISCDSDPVETPQPDLLPLEVGNQWVLSSARRDLLYDTLTVHTQVDTLRVIGSQVVDGEEWFEVRPTEGTLGVVGSFGGFYTNREDGVWRWDHPDGSGKAPLLLYKVPARPSESYSLPSEVVDITVTVVDSDTPLTTEAGIFTGNRYAFDSTFGWGQPIEEGAALNYHGLAPGVGFAQMTSAYLGVADDGDRLVRRIEFEWTLLEFED